MDERPTTDFHQCEVVKLLPMAVPEFGPLRRRVLEQDPKENPRREGEANFYRRHAVKLAPNDPEVLRIRAEVQEKIGKIETR